MSQFQNAAPSSTFAELPILKHLDSAAAGQLQVIDQAGNAISRWKRGEKGIPLIVGLAVTALIIYGLTIILPIVLTMLGHTIAAIASALLAGFFIMMLPLIYKMFRRMVRKFHKWFIESDPFGELADQLGSMKKSKLQFETAKKEINTCRVSMKTEAKNAEQKAKVAAENVIKSQEDVDYYKRKIDELLKKDPGAMETDEYVELKGKSDAAVGVGNRAINEANTFRRMVDTFASRAQIFAKLDMKLTNYGNAFDEKIKDFEHSIYLLKTEYTAMSAANSATTRVKNAVGGSQDWQLEYALEVISGQIASDIAQTQTNIKDLDSIIKDFNPSDERAYASLEKFANEIKEGNFKISDANKVSNVNHKLTSDQKAAGGSITDIFSN